ncbi:hypothetical protein HYPSUDRAFT_41064 [Hypholoma sublateritium FD-334 SS-4]|uniref:C3H1-type domain-containing protein n=1 Tax=Hypholoma sublateritium (strain FD-334 SS-4) TaxID=945553 RepID=A0A0D2MFR2_HYPSF|nr:hypothetical protein HYPSUDRAFT_41064 [Hypholoma sublateritium FD-334 SS-4]
MAQEGSQISNSEVGTVVPEVEAKSDATSVVIGVATPAEESSVVAGESVDTTPAASINVVVSKPKTTEELIAARALKRAARKTAIREKAEGHKRAGDLLFETHKYKAAYPHYLEATQLWASNPGYFISLAVVYRKMQWYEEAAYAATRALTLDPKNSEARYVRGVARMEQRLLKPARMDFETVLAHDPMHFLARAALTEVTHFIETSGHLGAHALAADPVEALTEGVDFGFPHYDQDALEIASVSDSSDCAHVGNGVQCRFYNHEGCARGNACLFSHAPDEKSVRDDLGRNVCTYFLLDSCKFGAAKCIYSHSREALPKNGWWSSPEQIEKAKAMMAVAEQKNREQRQLESERWKAYLKAMKAAGRPPKSAGIKNGNKRAPEKKTDAPEDAAPTEPEPAVEGQPAAAEAEATKPSPKKKAEGAKRKPQPRKKKVTAKPATEAADAPAVKEETASVEKSDLATTPGFTEYQLNVPPADINPDTSITLAY